MKKIVSSVLIISCIISCNSQENKVDKRVIAAIKANDFYIDNIDFLVVLNEIEYLLKNDPEITNHWESFVTQTRQDGNRNRDMKISNYYVKTYVHQNGTNYMKNKLSFIENINTNDTENVNYVLSSVNNEEVVGVEEMDYLFFAFFLQDEFFEMVEKDKNLQMIFENMLRDESFKLYLTLFDTTLCRNTEFRKRKIDFLKDRFYDCNTRYGKLFFEEINKIDIHKDY